MHLAEGSLHHFRALPDRTLNADLFVQLVFEAAAMPRKVEHVHDWWWAYDSHDGQLLCHDGEDFVLIRYVSARWKTTIYAVSEYYEDFHEYTEDENSEDIDEEDSSDEESDESDEEEESDDEEEEEEAYDPYEEPFKYRLFVRATGMGGASG